MNVTLGVTRSLCRGGQQAKYASLWNHLCSRWGRRWPQETLTKYHHTCHAGEQGGRDHCEV